MILSDKKVKLVERHNKVVYRDGDRIVKAFSPSKPNYDVFREALNLARMEPVDINTPTVREVSQLEDGSWALSYDYIPGTTLSDLMNEAASVEEENAYLEKFVDLQIKVQNTEPPLTLTSQYKKLPRMIGKVQELSPTSRYDMQMRCDRLRMGNCICHGDFIPSNIVVGEDGTYSILDWTHVTRGLPEADAALTYMLLHLDSKEEADRYLDMYSVRADIPKQKIFYWLPVVAAAELSRGRAKQEEFLRSWIDVAGEFE